MFLVANKKKNFLKKLQLSESYKEKAFDKRGKCRIPIKYSPFQKRSRLRSRTERTYDFRRIKLLCLFHLNTFHVSFCFAAFDFFEGSGSKSYLNLIKVDYD